MGNACTVETEDRAIKTLATPQACRMCFSKGRRGLDKKASLSVGNLGCEDLETLSILASKFPFLNPSFLSERVQSCDLTHLKKSVFKIFKAGVE